MCHCSPVEDLSRCWPCTLAAWTGIEAKVRYCVRVRTSHCYIGHMDVRACDGDRGMNTTGTGSVVGGGVLYVRLIPNSSHVLLMDGIVHNSASFMMAVMG